MTDEASEIMRMNTEKEGVKTISFCWTLGKYDTVVTMDAPNKKTAMKVNLMVNDFISTETMIAGQERKQ